MEWLKYLLLPPLVNVLLVVLGLLLWPVRSGLGLLLILLGFMSLLLLATPQVSHGLRQGLEHYLPPTPDELQEAEAIVILGGGRDYGAVEFDWGDAPSNATWRRLAYGVKLHRDTGLPILVSGGRVHDEPSSEASLMAAALREIFDVAVEWEEDQSRNTAENARFSADLLSSDGITRVVLVSQSWHLPRAVAEFERTGLDVMPAPTEFASQPGQGLHAWLPRAYHLRHSSQALHEWLGRAVQALRQRILNRP
ncbi:MULTISPECIES: YdcF family protein [Halomonadaceae]|uniref:YdcF family protein n=1 Tax=Halomonadaceae TaxID=28256 RepID=UPI001597DAC8|nr:MULTISPECIES: YdcF family protein [Halomonas]QJQ94245.1 YdcF family protein [Halomonas sp. PA5]